MNWRMAELHHFRLSEFEEVVEVADRILVIGRGRALGCWIALARGQKISSTCYSRPGERRMVSERTPESQALTNLTNLILRRYGVL